MLVTADLVPSPPAPPCFRCRCSRRHPRPPSACGNFSRRRPSTTARARRIRMPCAASPNGATAAASAPCVAVRILTAYLPVRSPTRRNRGGDTGIARHSLLPPSQASLRVPRSLSPVTEILSDISKDRAGHIPEARVYRTAQPNPRAALITIWTSRTLTTPSPFKSFAAGTSPSAWLIEDCTSETPVVPT